ncbi:MAG: HEPN domain-containing protein [Nanoarchaeota archaeon]
MKEEIKRWMEFAKDDLKKAHDNFNIENYNLSSFLCQQAVEKALKAMLIKKMNKYPKIHDLVMLGNLAGLDKNLLKYCEKLTFVYTETRYPDTSYRKYSKEESEEDIKNTEEILKWIGKKLL